MERQPCECGCGQLAMPGRRFLHGHNAASAKSRNGRWRVCRGCGKRVWVAVSEDAKWKSCSIPCSRALKRRAPRNALQEDCLEYLAEHHGTIASLARDANVSYDLLKRWFRVDGSTLSRDMLEHLARVLGISTQRAIAQAGGKTAEQQRQEAGARAGKRFAQLPADQRKARSRKGGLALVGTSQPVDSGKRRWAALVASGGAERAITALTSNARSPRGRALRTLSGQLRAELPPSEAQLFKSAQRSAARLGICTGEVIAWWNPWLKARGLPALGGRPRETKRCAALRAYLTTRPRVYGMWTGAPETKSWASEHARGCPTLRAVLVQVRRPNRTETPTIEMEAAMTG